MSFESLITSTNEIVWGLPLVILCLGTGIYFSVRTGFLQVRFLKEMMRLLLQGKESKAGVSSFQAFTIAISGRVGTGNIAGVATAIALGGPGAIFWMWVIAFLGAASAYVEATLGQIYKQVVNGEYRGGPSYYIEKGIGMKWYAVIFSIATILSMTFFLPAVQSQSISVGMETAFNIPPLYTGIAVAAGLALVIFGGVKRIGHVAQIVVPFMAFGYILMAAVIIFMNISHVPDVIMLIIKSALGMEQAFAGIVGVAIIAGVKRGIFSNEAGQGTAPHAASAAEVSHPAKQGLVQAFSVYIDTLFVCTATAFMILFTGQYNVVDPNVVGGFLEQNIAANVTGPGFTQFAVESEFQGFGHGFVAISLLFFVFTTLMAYYYMAETNVTYLDQNGKHKWLINVLRVTTLVTIIYATFVESGPAWQLGDIGVGIMAWLNIVAILILQKPALKALKDYQQQKREGKDPVFNPEALGIKNADYWDGKSK
jgi:alanine or glycine:cation symporter, AGCS family